MQEQNELQVYVRERRQFAGLTQAQLAERAGVTRQAISAIESGRYSPATSVALRLAETLSCRVEDFFHLRNLNQFIEAELPSPFGQGGVNTRTKLARINDRVFAWPLRGINHLTSLASAADGLIVGPGTTAGKVKVELCKDALSLERQIAVAGCDPAISLACEYFGRGGECSMFAATMGSAAALDALLLGQAHVAGIHLVDEDTGEYNLPYLRRHLSGSDFVIITFAAWQEGFIVAKGNPKRVRDAADLARPKVRLVNREPGSGARCLLDSRLAQLHISARQVLGYNQTVRSHVEVAWMIESGLADVGIAVETAAVAYDLDFIPLQRERYDLVLRKSHHEGHPGVKALLDVIASGRFRTEVEALGGYDMRETGKVWNLKAA